jgi:uncharacterized protein (DUF1697 family)
VARNLGRVGRHILLLRGINLGPNRRVAMPRLREVLEDAGFEDVRTYVQSGNIVLSSTKKPDKVAAECERAIADEFGFDVPVVIRTRDELAAVVKRNPLGKVAIEPKRYQVSFLDGKPDPELVKELKSLATESEEFTVNGREFYAWHPEGVARSKLWNKLAGKGLGVTATARNWTTVTTLLEMADE